MPADPGRTHWEGCYRDRAHHECAVAEVEQIRKLARAALDIREAWAFGTLYEGRRIQPYEDADALEAFSAFMHPNVALALCGEIDRLRSRVARLEAVEKAARDVPLELSHGPICAGEWGFRSSQGLSFSRWSKALGAALAGGAEGAGTPPAPLP